MSSLSQVIPLVSNALSIQDCFSRADVRQKFHWGKWGLFSLGLVEFFFGGWVVLGLFEVGSVFI